jgi:hypothetical protein
VLLVDCRCSVDSTTSLAATGGNVAGQVSFGLTFPELFSRQKIATEKFLHAAWSAQIFLANFLARSFFKIVDAPTWKLIFTRKTLPILHVNFTSLGRDFCESSAAVSGA